MSEHQKNISELLQQIGAVQPEIQAKLKPLLGTEDLTVGYTVVYGFMVAVATGKADEELVKNGFGAVKALCLKNIDLALFFATAPKVMALTISEGKAEQVAKVMNQLASSIYDHCAEIVQDFEKKQTKQKAELTKKKECVKSQATEGNGQHFLGKLEALLQGDIVEKKK